MVERLGTGILTWNSYERVTDRYGTVALCAGILDESYAPIAAGFAGQVGSLEVRVLQTRKSDHIGDLFRGFRVSTPRVGDRFVLGVGRLFYDEQEWGTSVGCEPIIPRLRDWLSPAVLYQVHHQTVDLFFVPSS